MNLGDLETAVDTAYAAKEVKESISELDKLPMKVNAAYPEQEILDENRKRLVDSIDAKTAPARENLAHVIIAAYHYIVDAKADDLVSYVSLCNRALKTFSLDVKILIGPQSNMPGVALAMVVNMVATGSAKVVGRKAIKPFKRSTKVSPIVELTENYIGKVYAKLKPKVEFQAEMDEAQIYGGSWVVELTSKATNMDDFRALDYKKDIESTVKNALESDRSKIYEMFAGLRGGGEVPIERKNLVQAGVSLNLAVQLEKQAKEVRRVATGILETWNIQMLYKYIVLFSRYRKVKGRKTIHQKIYGKVFRTNLVSRLNSARKWLIKSPRHTRRRAKKRRLPRKRMLLGRMPIQI